jgi:hypothetical protein
LEALASSAEAAAEVEVEAETEAEAAVEAEAVVEAEAEAEAEAAVEVEAEAAAASASAVMRIRGVVGSSGGSGDSGGLTIEALLSDTAARASCCARRVWVRSADDADTVLVASLDSAAALGSGGTLDRSRRFCEVRSFFIECMGLRLALAAFLPEAGVAPSGLALWGLVSLVADAGARCAWCVMVSAADDALRSAVNGAVACVMVLPAPAPANRNAAPTALFMLLFKLLLFRLLLFRLLLLLLLVRCAVPAGPAAATDSTGAPAPALASGRRMGGAMA